MPKHEFGIMPESPRPGKRYDRYEPWSYGCISVDDACLEDIAERLSVSLDCYWHTLSVKGRGLCYCGISLIPPDSLKAFLDIITDRYELSDLKDLLEKAMDGHKWVIHYGL